jgi:hypothetical protein
MAKASVQSGAYAPLNKQWKSLCKVLLGGEVGELSDYSAWLYEQNGPRTTHHSGISGKPVVYAVPKYSPNSKWASFDEVDLDAKYPALSINEIKDIDSIFEAVSERAIYAGNMVLGNSQFVEDSTNITDCFYVLHTVRVAFSKYMAYSSRGGYSEIVFGCYGFGPCRFSIKCGAAWDVNRGFCINKCDYSSDIYYSHGLTNCQDCMFSFNLKGKRRMIGNLQLEPAKYSELKAKLVAEIREKLKNDKRLPFLFELFAEEKPDYTAIRSVLASAKMPPAKKTDKSRIERAWSETTKVILGKPLDRLDRYGKWMEEKSRIHATPASSCVSGKPLIKPDYAWFTNFPADRLIDQAEADFSGEKLALSNAEVSSLSLVNAASKLSRIAYFCPQWLAGNLKNNIDSPLAIDSTDCYGGILNMLSKCAAFSYSARNCNFIFGCREPREITFCINTHFSTKSTRCLECDSCHNCSGLYFSHNCENVHDSMFCFNTKNKNYAIGNVEVGPEKFREAKKILLAWILKHLEATGSLPVDVYTIADKKKERKK